MYEFRKARFAFSAVAALALLLTLAGPADAGTLTVEAGSKYAGSYGLRVTPDATPAYVQSSHPSAEKTYRVRFYLNLTRLNLASGSSFDVFVAYDGADPLPSAAATGNAVLRVAVRQVGSSKVLDVFTRTDSGEPQLSSSPNVSSGWHAVELQWSAATAAGANNGFVNVWVNGFAQPSNLTGLDSDAQVINYARWGSVTGATTGTPPPGADTNSFRLDDFSSQRSGYIGLLSVFTDVPVDVYWPYIHRLYAAEITTGCAAGQYCPGNPVSRAEMAVFLIRGTRGPGFAPTSPTGVFADVPVSFWAAPQIEQLRTDGITTGCAANPLRFCPTDNVTRAEMAVFLLRARHGGSYTPPPPSGTLFADVPANHWAVSWIEQLYNEGITTGCANSPLRFCPESQVTRLEMAIFLSRTFNLPPLQTGP